LGEEEVEAAVEVVGGTAETEFLHRSHVKVNKHQ